MQCGLISMVNFCLSPAAASKTDSYMYVQDVTSVATACTCRLVVLVCLFLNHAAASETKSYALVQNVLGLLSYIEVCEVHADLR